MQFDRENIPYSERQLLKDDVYLNSAVQMSRLSKDKNTKIGAVIVASDGEPVSWGYNGMSKNVDDDKMPQSRETLDLCYYRNDELVCFKANKYPFISHAEANAIDFGDPDKLKGSTIYVTAFPCDKCCQRIINAGIKRVVVRESLVDEGSSLRDDNMRNCVEFHLATARIDLTVNGKSIILIHPRDRD